MGNRLVGLLKRVFEHALNDRSWSPSSLDPYGLVAMTDTHEEAEREALFTQAPPVVEPQPRDQIEARTI